MGKVKDKIKSAVDSVKQRVSRKRKTKQPGTLDGEHHGVLWVPGDGFQRANYMGPGTQIIERLRRGDKGKTPIDQISQLHDIEYTMASGLARDDSELKQQIRSADERMMYSGWNAFLEGRESWFNTLEGAGLIKAKTLLEDWGLLNPTRFVSPRTLKYRLDAEKRQATEFELLERARSGLLSEGHTADPHEKSRVAHGNSIFNTTP